MSFLRSTLAATAPGSAVSELESLDLMVAASWKPLTSQADCDALMKLFGGFHDGCIREAHVWTETSVDAALGMSCPSHLDTRIQLLIQRQWKAPSAIELLFEQVVTFHLQPSADNYDSIIFSAEMLCRDDTFYWADLGGWLPESPSSNDATWVAAKSVSWRDASEWMGSDLHYGSGAAKI